MRRSIKPATKRLPAWGAFCIRQNILNILSPKKYPHEISAVFHTAIPSADQPMNQRTGIRISPAGMETIVRSTGMMRHSASRGHAAHRYIHGTAGPKERNFSLLPNTFSMIGSPPQ